MMENITNLYETLEKSIVNYTGLSAATFFTILAVAVTLYYLVSGWLEPLAPSRQRDENVVLKPPPPPPPVQLGDITEEELRAYDGTDPKKPLLMAIKGQIYDVTRSRAFYGPGGPYSLFAGRDASRALAKMSFDEKDLTGDISELGPLELDALQDWEFQFMGKYEKVGTIKKTVPVAFTNTASESDVKIEDRECVETAADVETEDKELVETGSDVTTQDKEQVEAKSVTKTEDNEHVEAESITKTEDKGHVEVKEEEEAGASDN